MLSTISELEFLSEDPVFRVIEHEHPRRFGSLRLPDASHALTLSWSSNLIEPIIEVNSSEVWIGVDLRIVCLSPQGSVLFSIALSSYLLQIERFQACTVALCESDLIAINNDYSLRQMCYLRDVPNWVGMKNDKFVVEYITGEREAL